jgi:hypothetical protein
MEEPALSQTVVYWNRHDSSADLKAKPIKLQFWFLTEFRDPTATYKPDPFRIITSLRVAVPLRCPFVPTYASIGIWGAVILTLMRMV